jgi:hypothetical protein
MITVAAIATATHMPTNRSTAGILICFAALQCKPVSANPVSSIPCPVVTDSDLTADWNPLTLGGEYRVEWMRETGEHVSTDRLRLFLWQTSMRDSSTREKTGAAPGDTATHPLYGVMVRDTGAFTSARVGQLRAAVDPIYPPVLLIAHLTKNSPLPDRYWTALLVGTSGNRRDGVRVTDGVGVGMWVRQADANGFRGTFGPWGIALTEKGHYCAERVRG